MRKQYKRKSKSICQMCKCYKSGWAKRWDEREWVKRLLFAQRRYDEL